MSGWRLRGPGVKLVVQFVEQKASERQVKDVLVAPREGQRVDGIWTERGGRRGWWACWYQAHGIQGGGEKVKKRLIVYFIRRIAVIFLHRDDGAFVHVKTRHRHWCRLYLDPHIPPHYSTSSTTLVKSHTIISQSHFSLLFIIFILLLLKIVAGIGLHPLPIPFPKRRHHRLHFNSTVHAKSAKSLRIQLECI